MTRRKPDPYIKEYNTILLATDEECPRLRGKAGFEQIRVCVACTRQRCYHDSPEERELSRVMAQRARKGARMRRLARQGSNGADKEKAENK